MPIKKILEPNGVIKLRVTGFFDCSFATLFDSLEQDLAPPIVKCVVDLTQTEYINSFAVGQLLRLHKMTTQKEITLELMISEFIRDIFDTMNITDKFDNVSVS